MDNHHLLNAISRVSTLGVTLVSSIAVGMFLGHLLDNWLNSSPWGIIAGILLGIVAGFYGILKIVLANQDR
ncbi:ATP synthase protein I [Sporomusaceae bacterium BoRhaA]|jgi:ATP synthase protein I|uniref:AtpZ/AtpI family protein n=1 Tax=Pelorhabdus rhamnosifermentans TaxID=2772457 RepID=UPI001C063549|nr:AtpZ/AtpI family protein [Pelorhabdus rhamnosifermentans]MBU2698928.1 ATP synthase protein I [Pelorhabdus rhamnosifermentans]